MSDAGPLVTRQQRAVLRYMAEGDHVLVYATPGGWVLADEGPPVDGRVGHNLTRRGLVKLHAKVTGSPRYVYVISPFGRKAVADPKLRVTEGAILLHSYGDLSQMEPVLQRLYDRVRRNLLEDPERTYQLFTGKEPPAMANDDTKNFSGSSATSAAAGRSVSEEHKIGIMALILQVVKGRGPIGMTADEVLVALSLEHQSGSPRFTDLVKRGLLVPRVDRDTHDGEPVVATRKTRKGRAAIVYVIGDGVPVEKDSRRKNTAEPVLRRALAALANSMNFHLQRPGYGTAFDDLIREIKLAEEMIDEYLEGLKK